MSYDSSFSLRDFMDEYDIPNVCDALDCYGASRIHPSHHHMLIISIAIFDITIAKVAVAGISRRLSQCESF